MRKTAKTDSKAKNKQPSNPPNPFRTTRKHDTELREALRLATRFEYRADKLSRHAATCNVPEAAENWKSIASVFRDTAASIRRGAFIEQYFLWVIHQSDSSFLSVAAGLTADRHRETSGGPNFPKVADIVFQFFPGVEASSEAELLRKRVKPLESRLRRGAPLREFLKLASTFIEQERKRNLSHTIPERPDKSLPK